MAVTPTCAGHPLPTKLAELVREIEIGIHYGITSVTLCYRAPRSFLACAGETTQGKLRSRFICCSDRLLLRGRTFAPCVGELHGRAFAPCLGDGEVVVRCLQPGST